MTSDEMELRVLRNLILWTINRASAYPNRIVDEKIKHRAQKAVDELGDIALGLELSIKELEN